MIVSKKSALGQKLATSKKKLVRANTISDLGLLIQTNYRWSSTPRFIKATFNFANVIKEAYKTLYVLKINEFKMS